MHAGGRRLGATTDGRTVRLERGLGATGESGKGREWRGMEGGQMARAALPRGESREDPAISPGACKGTPGAGHAGAEVSLFLLAALGGAGQGGHS